MQLLLAPRYNLLVGAGGCNRAEYWVDEIGFEFQQSWRRWIERPNPGAATYMFLGVYVSATLSICVCVCVTFCLCIYLCLTKSAYVVTLRVCVICVYCMLLCLFVSLMGTNVLHAGSGTTPTDQVF